MLLHKLVSVLSGSFLFAGVYAQAQSQSQSSAPAIPQVISPATAAPSSGLPALETGVSATLAAGRSALLKDIRYDLQFHIPAQREEPIPAEETILFTLSAGSPAATGMIPPTSDAGSPAASGMIPPLSG